MKILFLNTHLNTGGITSYLLTLSSGLRKKGYDVFIVSSGGDREDDFKRLGCETFQLNIRTKSELSPKIYSALGVIRKLINEKNIDIIHSHTRITQVMGEILSHQTKKIHVTTCHGYFRPNLGRRIFPCWGKKTIAISKEVKDHLTKDFNRSENQIQIVTSGVDVGRFSKISGQEIKQFREKYNLKDEVVIGIVARLSDVKGIDILISAMKAVIKTFPSAKLFIVGEGKEEANLKQMVRDLSLNDCIQFLPIVNQTSEILSLFDIFAMPSRQEGLGLSIMEAQASGVPVVASNVGGIPTLIQHNVTGILVPKENPEMLAEALIELIKDKDKRLRLGEAGRRFIAENYSSERMVQETIQFYQSVLI